MVILRVVVVLREKEEFGVNSFCKNYSPMFKNSLYGVCVYIAWLLHSWTFAQEYAPDRTDFESASTQKYNRSNFISSQYDAVPVSWPPLPKPGEPKLKIFNANVNSEPAAPPLIVYSQPGIQSSSNGLRIKPHLIQHMYGPEKPNFGNASRSVEAVTVTPKQVTQGIKVLTTPFGLAWRNGGFYLREHASTVNWSTPISDRSITSPISVITDQVTTIASVISNQTATDHTESVASEQTTSWSAITDQIKNFTTKRPNPFLHFKRPQPPAPNRIKGKPHILCMANGIMFIAETYLEFTGLIYARGRENETNCSYVSDNSNGEINGKSINVSFPYADCGEPIIAQKGDHAYQTDVVVSFRDGRIQTFLARCVSQKLRYEDDDLPRRIEEALEELNIKPEKVENQAQMPMCTMRVVQEMEEQHHHYGPSNESMVNDAFIGQKLRMEFSLNPPSAAFGFLIRNCTVLDSSVDMRYVIIDDKGCSVDINIFAHPHYDTYHDLAIVHWHAFKVPDSALLSFRCDCVVCTEMADDETGQNSCEQIPTPPICPDIVTSSTLQNALIFDSSQNLLKKKKRHALEQNVRTGFCLSTDQGNCTFETEANEEYSFSCISRWFFATCLAFNISLLITSSVAFFSTLIKWERKDCRGRKRGSLSNVIARIETGT